MALREYELRPGLYYYINDHLGTPQRLITGEGTVVWQAAALPFGRTQVQLGTVQNNLRFPGQYFDAEAGLHYNWNRYYDPETGRYLSPDPIGLDGGLNLYAYVENDPVNYVDPEGLSKTEGLPGSDPYYHELKEASADICNRAKKIELIEKRFKLEKKGMKPERVKKIMGWIKTAKDGRILGAGVFIAPSVMPNNSISGYCLHHPDDCLEMIEIINGQ